MKKKELPFCYPYSLKARVLVLSHLARMDVSDELEEGRTCRDELVRNVECFRMQTFSESVSFLPIPDQRFVIRKSPALLQEMINVGCQLTMMANSRGGTFPPVRVFPLPACKSLFARIVELFGGLSALRFPRSSAGNHRELHEADADDSAGPAGVQISSSAAAAL